MLQKSFLETPLSWVKKYRYTLKLAQVVSVPVSPRLGGRMALFGHFLHKECSDQKTYLAIGEGIVQKNRS